MGMAMLTSNSQYKMHENREKARTAINYHQVYEFRRFIFIFYLFLLLVVAIILGCPIHLVRYSKGIENELNKP